MILVTAASENHERSLLQLLDSLRRCRVPANIVVYDLGLSHRVYQQIRTDWKIPIRRFPFEKYPPYFRMEQDAGQYAWKPVIIQQVALEYPHENIVWMDAGNVVYDDLSVLDMYITETGVFTAVSSGTIERWTHPGTLNYMQVPDSLLHLPCRNAACVGFNMRVPFAKEMLDEWARLAQVQECIAPEGATRLNHRHDQAVLTILFYKKQQEKRFGACSYLCGPGYSIHNDID